MVKVFAPVNIAWIKYMGKLNGLPTNSSFSMTLDQIGTHTSIKQISTEGALTFRWSSKGYVPPKLGQEKAERFLTDRKIWKSAFEKLKLTFIPPTGTFEIETQNNVPAGTGIATSASGYAALTLAWFGVLQGDRFSSWKYRYQEEENLKRTLADLARSGSGSACRSFEGPFVEWDPRSGTHQVETRKLAFVDFILIFETEAKAVSSSEAHLRVASSPHFQGRVGRAEFRLAEVKSALKKGDLIRLQKVVLLEALDMHDLFHTSEPPFTYLREESKAWIKRFEENDPSLPSLNGILTLDAGANCHVFVPENEEALWENYLKNSHPEVNFVKAKSGKGASYVD